MKAQNLIGKTIKVRKLGYELLYEVKKVEEYNGISMLEGVVTEASESCPFHANDPYFISEAELKSKNYPVLNLNK